MEKYDVVVVGAGPGGSSAAYYLASRGYEVMLIEKAKVPGHRNMTGGVLYTRYLEGYGAVDVFPGFESEAPLERRVTRYKVVVLGNPRFQGGEFRYRVYEIGEGSPLYRVVHGGALESPGYTVIRSRLDKWMAGKVEEAGGILVTGQAVEDLLFEDGRVAGVRTSREDVACDLVIDASGVTSTLVVKAGLRGPLKPAQVYHGIKQVYRLGEDEINSRFGLRPGEGMAITLMGDFLHGARGGGFIYTNRDTVSVGIALPMDSMLSLLRERPWEVGKPLDILEELVGHPYVRDLIEGGELVEYSAHNVPRGQAAVLKKPFAPGFLAVGDALGAFVKIGALIDGMRRAIATGVMAARAYIHAKRRGDFGESALSVYLDLLKPIYRDLRRARVDGAVSESGLLYGPGYRLALAVLGTSRSSRKGIVRGRGDAIQRVQSRTGILEYDEDKEYSHIRVEWWRADRDEHKLWVPACPYNCYTLVVEGKGVFASYKDLYEHNLELLSRRGGPGDPRSRALEETRRDVRRGRVRFDHVACVECGTCWVIGPPDTIIYGHARDGHGVKFKYG